MKALQDLQSNLTTALNHSIAAGDPSAPQIEKLEAWVLSMQKKVQ